MKSPDFYETVEEYLVSIACHMLQRKWTCVILNIVCLYIVPETFIGKSLSPNVPETKVGNLPSTISCPLRVRRYMVICGSVFSNSISKVEDQPIYFSPLEFSTQLFGGIFVECIKSFTITKNGFLPNGRFCFSRETVNMDTG